MRGERQLRDLLPPAQRQQASDFATSGKTTDYTATVSVTPASSAKDILAFGPGATISGTNIAWFVPFGSDVTNLTPTYSVSAFASADASFASGTARNFTTPQTYTITAQDTTTVSATAGTYAFSGSLAGAGMLTKSNGGSLNLDAANSYTGGTLISGGTVSCSLQNSSPLGGAGKVQAGTLAFSRSNSLGSGSLDITAGAKVQLDYIGTRQISALTYDAGATKPNGSYGSSRSLATFKDDTRFSGLGTVTIGAITGATTTTLARTSGNEPSNGGESLTFTATVAGASPTGNVMFSDGLTFIGTSALNGSFQATLTSSSLSAGSHVISALYAGSAGNASSTGNLTQTVVETRTLATTTTLSSSANPSAYGASVTFTATVAGSTPAGSVMFYNGTNPLGTATLNGGGLASLAISNLASGWQPITARYWGDATHLPSATASAWWPAVS